MIARRRWPHRVLVTANVLVALTILGAASAYGYVKWRFAQIHTKSISTLTQKNTGGGAPFTLLVVGSDSRAAIAANNGNNQAFGSGSEVGGQRSDTIILVRVVPDTRQLMILSIPRDLWGPIPGHGSDRINSAFNNGPALLVQTIQQDLGIPINHYVEVNFDSFRDISNAVGGIKVYFPTQAKDAFSGLSAGPGCVTLQGDSALAFVRSRHYQYYLNGSWHYEALSDLARIQRQQMFVKKMIKKAEGEFTNPIALNSVIAGVTKNLTVDSSFGTTLMLDLTRDFRSINATAIPNVTIPTYPFTTSGGAEVLGLQQPQAGQAIAAFNAFGSTPPPPTTPKPSSTVPAATLPPVTVAPSSVSIEVANGSGGAGQANSLVSWLTSLGYHAGVIASRGYGHATTQIRYAPDSLTAAQQIAAKVPGGATLVVAPDLTPTPYNLEIITGSSYTATAAGTSPTTPTTLPGTSNYELPGSSGPAPANC